MAFDIAAWAWPQWTVAIIYGVNMLLYAIMDGKPRTGNYSLSLSMFGTAISVGLLYAGGFWA